MHSMKCFVSLVSFLLFIFLFPTDALVIEEEEFLKDFIRTFACTPPPDWNESDVQNACNWDGIQCNPDGLHITEIALVRKNICLSIPPSIGNLSALVKIDIREVQGRGDLPNELCNLHELVHLALAYNSFTGVIPSCFNETNFPNLGWLDLASNRLTGTIPETLFTSNLAWVSLSSNALFGTIPESIVNATSLYYISLRSNSLVGTIPAAIADLPNLKHLGLSKNNFSCPIGELVSKLIPRKDSITHCDLSYNFYEKTENGICNELKYPFPNVCKLLPVPKRSVAYEGSANYTIKEQRILVEVYDNAFYFFALHNDGSPFRDEYIAYDLNSWYHEYDSSTLEQVEIPAFTTFEADTRNRKYTFGTTMLNDAQLNVSLYFNTDINVKMELRLSNWNLTRISDSLMFLYLQLSIISPHTKDNQTVQCSKIDLLNYECSGPHLNITVGIVLPDFVFSAISARGVESSFVVSGMYSLDGSNFVSFATPREPDVYLLPYGEVNQINYLGAHNFGYEGIIQAVSGVFDITFEPWESSLLWDPDVSIRLLFDYNTPSESSEQKKNIGIAVGVTIGIGVPLVATVAIIAIIRRRKKMAKLAEQSEKVEQAMKRIAKGDSSKDDSSKGEWTASHTPSNLSNVKTY